MAKETNVQTPPTPQEIKQFTAPEDTSEKWSAGIRENLKNLTNKFFTALTSHNPSMLHCSPDMKCTENGNETNMRMGEGLWQTAGEVLLKRTLIDTKKIGTYTLSIIEENGKPIIYSVRLGFDGGKFREVEMIIAREKDFAFNAQGILKTKGQDWESILPREQRSSRLAMIAAADDYFNMFAMEPEVSTPFAQICDRWENGTQTTVKSEGFPWPEGMTEHNCTPKGLVIPSHGPRRFLVDVEAGSVVAFMHFANSLPDCHVFKMRYGKVELIFATVGSMCKSMGWPIETSNL